MDALGKTSAVSSPVPELSRRCPQPPMDPAPPGQEHPSQRHDSPQVTAGLFVSHVMSHALVPQVTFVPLQGSSGPTQWSEHGPFVHVTTTFSQPCSGAPPPQVTSQAWSGGQSIVESLHEW